MFGRFGIRAEKVPMAGIRRRDFIAAAGSTAVAWPLARSPDWLKFKNPAAPAVKREAEEDWGR